MSGSAEAVASVAAPSRASHPARCRWAKGGGSVAMRWTRALWSFRVTAEGSVGAGANGSKMAPQRLENIDSARGNGMASEGSDRQDLAPRASPYDDVGVVAKVASVALTRWNRLRFSGLTGRAQTLQRPPGNNLGRPRDRPPADLRRPAPWRNRHAISARSRPSCRSKHGRRLALLRHAGRNRSRDAVLRDFTPTDVDRHRDGRSDETGQGVRSGADSCLKLRAW